MLFRKKKKKSVATTKTVSKQPRPNPIPKQKVEPLAIKKNDPQAPKQKRIIEKEKQPKENIDAKKRFLNAFKKLTYRHRAWDVWRDFVIMFACALSNPVDKEHFDIREKRYLSIINKYKKEEQEIFPELAAFTVMALEENPEQDFLGSIFMSLDLGDGNNGQFFTPYHVCDLMAKVSMGETVAEQVRENGYISIHDPCCGAGATLIAGIHEAKRQLEKENLNYQNHVLVVAQDIDETVGLMCYIQLSLLGVAGYVKIGNALTEPVAEDDSREHYWYTPIYFSEIWTIRRIFRGGH